jgi:hypothetical protein
MKIPLFFVKYAFSLSQGRENFQIFQSFWIGKPRNCDDDRRNAGGQNPQPDRE